MNKRRLSPRLRIQFVGLLMLMGMAALGLCGQGSKPVRCEWIGKSAQLASDSANSVRARRDQRPQRPDWCKPRELLKWIFIFRKW